MNWMLFNILLAATVLSWWLSGFDTGLSRQDGHKRADFIRRAVRCGVTLVLMAIGVGFGGVIMIAAATPIAIIWAGCLSELFARGFNQLIDSDDSRPFDPKEIERELDRLAGLVQNGQNHDAVALCQRLQESGDASVLAMEAMLFRLYDQMYADDRLAASPVLAEAWRLRSLGRFAEAEAAVNKVLERDPATLAATLLLLRICGQDLRRPDKNQAVLQHLGALPDVLPAFFAFAHRRADEWSGTPPPKDQTGEGIESLLVQNKPPPLPETVEETEPTSIDELLADGRLATAVELIEARLKAEPDNFDLWLKLAEAHARYCSDLVRAARIIKRIEDNAAFSPEQTRVARTKLKEWRAAAGA